MSRVIASVNGRLVTSADILNSKREWQRKRLQQKLAQREPVRKPCFVWTFCNDGPLYGGWWLYIRTLNEDYGVSYRRNYRHLVPKVMALYPCGFEPDEAKFKQWAEVFATTYHRPTAKRPAHNGLALAVAEIAPNGQLLMVHAMNRIDEIVGGQV